MPIMVFTNNLGDMQPVSFAKGAGEEEMGLSKYLTMAINVGDVMIGISASGGTGFVYDALERAREGCNHRSNHREHRHTSWAGG